MIRLLCIACLIFMSRPPAQASSIKIDFDSMVAWAPVVALVEIEKGELVKNTKGESCGARYLARVITPIKGVQSNDQLDFGFYTGRGIGEKFFVFLQVGQYVLQRSNQQPQISMSSIPLYLARCSKQLPPYLEVAEGMGTIHVVNGDAVGYKPAIELTNSYHIIPAQLVGSHKYTGQILDDFLFGSVQIETETFVEYLRSLAATAR